MADPLLGEHLGRYELRALLGVGGMARVYTAFDHILEREVALKVLNASLQQADVAERFRREARTLASLRHPYIVHVYDYGQQGDLRFMVQQLQPGPTLEQELAALTAQGCFMERAAVQQVIAQLADALDYAHSHHVIHRDLKPSNIIRNERGDVVVTDFGIAKALAGPLTATRTGWVLGTPAYLSPEQARGSPSLTPASDIYSLGVILFELLAGQVPFDHPQPMEVLLSHIQQPPPPLRSLRPDLPPAVQRVVLQALAKDPAARYVTAGAMARALIAAWPAAAMPSVHSLPTTVNPAPGRASRPAIAAVAGPQPAHNPRTASNPPVAPANPAARSRAAAADSSPARWYRSYRTGFAVLTLPALLMMVVALFFAGDPGGPPAATPTPRTSSASASMPGSATSSFTPTFTPTPSPTATPTPSPTFTPTPSPTATRTSAPTLTSTLRPTAAPTVPPPPPQPTVKVPDF